MRGAADGGKGQEGGSVARCEQQRAREAAAVGGAGVDLGDAAPGGGREVLDALQLWVCCVLVFFFWAGEARRRRRRKRRRRSSSPLAAFLGRKNAISPVFSIYISISVSDL